MPTKTRVSQLSVRHAKPIAERWALNRVPDRATARGPKIERTDLKAKIGATMAASLANDAAAPVPHAASERLSFKRLAHKNEFVTHFFIHSVKRK